MIKTYVLKPGKNFFCLKGKKSKQIPSFRKKKRRRVSVFADTLLYTKDQKDIVTSLFLSYKKHSSKKDSSCKLPETYELKKELFKTLDLFNTNFPLLIGNKPSVKIFDFKKPPQGLEVFCALKDPSNLGAFLRSCVAFKVSKVILLKEACSAFLPKVLKTSSGLCLKAPLFEGPSLLELEKEFKKEKDFLKQTIALDPKGKDLSTLSLKKSFRLLVGEEGQGLALAFKKKAFKIPMNPQVESLNAVIATSIFLYHYRQSYPLS